MSFRSQLTLGGRVPGEEGVPVLAAALPAQRVTGAEDSLGSECGELAVTGHKLPQLISRIHKTKTKEIEFSEGARGTQGWLGNLIVSCLWFCPRAKSTVVTSPYV